MELALAADDLASEGSGVACAAKLQEKKLLTIESTEVYSFDVLRPAVCQQLIEEVQHFQSTGLEARRPNSSSMSC